MPPIVATGYWLLLSRIVDISQYDLSDGGGIIELAAAMKPGCPTNCQVGSDVIA